VKNCLAAITQPLLIYLMSTNLYQNLSSISLNLVLISSTILLSGSSVILVTLSFWKISDLKIIPFFRAFITAWTEQYNEPLEYELSKISKKITVETDKLTFTDPSGKCIGNLIVPYIHPGPFRNVGSSGLGYEICKAFNDNLTFVAHGISNHEADMVSRNDISIVISNIKNTPDSNRSNICTIMSRAEINGAKASCQIFGNIALISLTLSPKSHDDIPDVVKESIRKEAANLGLQAVIVDAHNCLDFEDFLDEYDADNLIVAAHNALLKASALDQIPFTIGFSSIRPDGWNLDQGMGPCGIGLIALTTINGGRYAYAVIDSNNMIKGLREVILSKLSQLGFNDGEVFTSDTHLVNAIGATTRGYHPFGEVLDWDKVLNYIKIAYSNLEMFTSYVNFSRTSTIGIRVIGSDGLLLLKDILRSSFTRFITITLVTLPLSFILAGLIIYLL